MEEIGVKISQIKSKVAECVKFSLFSEEINKLSSKL